MRLSNILQKKMGSNTMSPVNTKHTTSSHKLSSETEVTRQNAAGTLVHVEQCNCQSVRYSSLTQAHWRATDKPLTVSAGSHFPCLLRDHVLTFSLLVLGLLDLFHVLVNTFSPAKPDPSQKCLQVSVLSIKCLNVILKIIVLS